MKLKPLFLMLSIVATGTAHAAFYVEDDAMPRTAQAVQAIYEAPTVIEKPTIYNVPFVYKRTAPGPAARKALQLLLQEAKQSFRIVVIGHGDTDTSPEEMVADNRAYIIKKWLVQNGVPYKNIEIKTSSMPLSAGHDIFNSEVMFLKTNQESTPPVTRNANQAMAEPKQTELPKDGTREDTATYEPSKAALATKIIAMGQNKLIKQEDMLILLNELLKTSSETTNKTTPAITTTVGTYQPPSIQRQIVLQPDPSYSFVLDASKTLKTNIEEWASQAGWQKPEWLPANPYQITFTSSVKGTMIEALEQISKAVPEIDIQVIKKSRMIKILEGKTK